MKLWWAEALRLALAVVVGLLAGGLILLLSRPSHGQGLRLSPPPTPAPLLVEVAGAVAQPGVYSLPAGSRVQDALQAASGLLAGAQTNELNLAALLEDGQRVRVPFKVTSTAGAPSRSGEVLLVNINTASAEELERLPGIGPVLAAEIVSYRQEHGQFANVEAIQAVPGIGPGIFEHIQPFITIETQP
jgi:competence protein ComEA